MTKREAQLEAEIAKLKNEIAQLKQGSGWSKIGTFFRNTCIFLCVIICALMLNLAVAAGWLKKNIVNTEVWTEKTSQIMQSESVQKDIATQITTEIFTATDAQSLVEEIVPPRASALAIPLTNSLQSYTEQQVQKIIASEKFQNYWTEINRSAHAGIIASLENGGNAPKDNNYVIYIDDEKLLLNLRPVIQQIQTELSSQGLSFVSSLNTNNINRTITLTEIQSLPTVLTAFNILNKGFTILLLIAVATGVGALVLSTNKRRVIMWLSILTMLLMVLNVQVIYLAKYPAIEKIASSLQTSSTESASTVLSILTDDLVFYNRMLMLLAFIVFISAVMTGPYKFATFIRLKIAQLTKSKNNNKLLTNLAENSTTYIAIMAGLYAITIVFNLVKNTTVSLVILLFISLVSIWLVSLKTALHQKR